MTDTGRKGRVSKAANKAAGLETDLTKMTRDERLEALRTYLQAEPDAKKLETMAAEMIGELLDIGVAIAKSGYQAGGDGGTVGREGRRLRIETKKYADTTTLDERELLGEIDHAIQNDPALEGWILVATRNASEQLETQLLAKGERLGVPVIVLDWKPVQMPTLAALCASYPTLVGRHFCAQAQALAASFTSEASVITERVGRELQSWQLGFETLRGTARAKLMSLWGDPRQAHADFGQDVAGGARTHRLRRERPFGALEAWWAGRALEDAPAVLLGYGGAGKTWATFDWLVDRAEELPIIIAAPASTGAELEGTSEAGLKTWLADRLQTIGDRHDRKHWRYRVDRLLARPPEEGPAILLLLDGLNQESSVDWLRVLKVFLGSAFAGRVRVIVTTRPFHKDDRLGKLAGLVVKPEEIEVPLYDLEPGGELDQMLAFHALTRASLPGDLLELARTPRLFDLVVRFGPGLVGQGQVTVHRLLWEYGRDSLGVRAGGGSFSEPEWRDWLVAIAKDARDGVRRYGRKDLSQTLDTTTRTESEVFQRLSDIVDGRFATQDMGGGFVLNARIVDHALGAALLTHLTAFGDDAAALAAALSDWLDPIAGLDHRAEILRAAVSIQLELAQVETPVTTVLLAAWLQGQNVPEEHRPELVKLGRALLAALLPAIERCGHASHAGARRWALEALEEIDRADTESLSAMVEAARRWLSVISRGLARIPTDDPAVADQIETARVQRVTERIGFDRSGPTKVLGVPMRVVDRDDDTLAVMAIKMLGGFPRLPTLPAIEAAAIAAAASGSNDAWEGLWWDTHLNEIDPVETREALGALAADLRTRSPEASLNLQLPAMAAAKVLRLTGEREDAEVAWDLEPDRAGADYQTDYLAQPGLSLFHRLEHRHAVQALGDTRAQLVRRLQRAAIFLQDPAFNPPPGAVAEALASASTLDRAQLDRAMGQTGEDHFLDHLAVILAHSAPAALRDLLQEKIDGYGARPIEARYWSAIHASDDLIGLDGSERASVRKLRDAGVVERPTEESWARAQCLIVELRDAPALEQWTEVIEADLSFMPVVLTEGLRPCTRDEIDTLFSRYGSASEKTQLDLLLLLSSLGSPVSETVRTWIVAHAASPQDEIKGVAYRVLARADLERFGRELLAREWICPPANTEDWIGHYGSEAIIAAGKALPLEQVLSRIAPSRVLSAVRQRGSIPEEVGAAAAIIGRVLGAPMIDPVDLGADLAVGRDDDGPARILSIQSREDEVVEEDAVGRLRAALEFGAAAERHQRAVKVVLARIAEMRAAGAQLFLTSLDARDIELVFDHAPREIDRWLLGLDEERGAFDHRLRLAEGVYMAVCEVLLARRPAQGTVLWKRMRSRHRIEHRGADELDEVMLLPFKAPSSPDVDALRLELFEPPYARTDAQLLAVVRAALSNGRTDWLRDRIIEDKASPFVWRRRRAEVVSAWTPGTRTNLAWPEGPVRSGAEFLERWADDQARTDRFARHWWGVYRSATTPAEALAAWRLFLASADVRALSWVSQGASPKIIQGLDHARFAHELANWQAMTNNLKKKTERLEDRFLGQLIKRGFGLWRDVEA